MPSGEPSDSVVDLLGALAYGELSAFDHLAEDARMAPSLAARAEMSAMAAVEFGHFRQLSDRITQLGHDPSAAMAPFTAALEGYHALTAPVTWLEAVVKAYVGYGIADDFYGEIAGLVDESTAQLIRTVLADAGRADFAVREVRGALEATPADSGRLALFARRLVGEAMSQAQHVLAERDPLMTLLVDASDLAGIAALMTRITDRHTERMGALGLSN